MGGDLFQIPTGQHKHLDKPLVSRRQITQRNRREIALNLDRTRVGSALADPHRLAAVGAFVGER